MDGRGPAHLRTSGPRDSAPGHDGPAGTDDGRDRSAARSRTAAALVDLDHAPGLVASGPRRLHLATAAPGGGCTWRRLPVLFPPFTTVWGRLRRWRELAVLDRALAALVACLRLARVGSRPQAAADGGDHRHTERADWAA